MNIAEEAVDGTTVEERAPVSPALASVAGVVAVGALLSACGGGDSAPGGSPSGPGLSGVDTDTC